MGGISYKLGVKTGTSDELITNPNISDATPVESEVVEITYGEEMEEIKTIDPDEGYMDGYNQYGEYVVTQLVDPSTTPAPANPMSEADYRLYHYATEAGKTHQEALDIVLQEYPDSKLAETIKPTPSPAPAPAPQAQQQAQPQQPSQPPAPPATQDNPYIKRDADGYVITDENGFVHMPDGSKISYGTKEYQELAAITIDRMKKTDLSNVEVGINPNANNSSVTLEAR